MAYEKIYTRVNWENEPSTRTPINEDNLNNMDSAIDELDNRVVELSEYTPCIQEVEELPEQGVEKLIYQLPSGDIAIWNGSSFVQYQQKLTVGTNVSITNNVISATDTTYSALPNGGIDINENNQISVKAVNTILFEQDEDMSIEQTFDYTQAQFENHFKINISKIDDAYNNRRLDSIMALVSVYGGVLDSYNEEHKITKLAIWDVGTGYMYWLRFDKFEMYFETTVSGSTITRVAGYVKTTGTNTVYGDGLQATVLSGTTTVKVKAKTFGGIKVQSIGISVNHDDSLKVAAVTTDYKLGVADTLLIRGSASGSVASISDGGANMPMKSCLVSIEPVQSGSGDPSPSNVRPITGWTECNITVADDETTPTISNVYNIQFPSEAGTVYGGTLDVTNGVLTVDRAMVVLEDLRWNYTTNRASTILPNCVIPTSSQEPDAIAEKYIGVKSASTLVANDFAIVSSSGNAQLLFYYDGTPITGKLVYKMATPTTYNVTPTEIKTLLGINNIFADTGDIENIEYTRDATIVINNLLARIQELENA